MTAEPVIRVTAGDLRQLTAAILSAWGMPARAAAETARLIVETDLLGIDSHGVSMLPFYETLRASGKWRPEAVARLIRDLPCTALLDGDQGLGYCTAWQAMQLAVGKARQTGVGVVAVRNSNHFGAAGLYARAATRCGLIGLVTSTARLPMMMPTHARQPVLGTNPIAFAAPARRNRPFVLDMATTTVAANKVKVYELQNRDIPAGWVVDGKGRPVTDSAMAMDHLFRSPEGGLSALGGSPDMGSHKGYGLCMLAQILAGPLGGAVWSSHPQEVGHFFLALDPQAFRPEGAFEKDLDSLIDVLHATPPVDPARPVLVAGDPEAAARAQRLRDGIPLPRKLQDQLREISRRAGIDPCPGFLL